MTAGTKYDATRSASLCTGARLRCASLIMRTICASIVSLPTRSARITKLPLPFTVPPTRRAPSNFSTGMGSPVISDSSTELDPSVTNAVSGNSFSRADAKHVSHGDVLGGDVNFGAVGANETRSSWRKLEQCANGV